jgi:hypothetical protein
MTSHRFTARLALTAAVSAFAVAALTGCSVLENIFPAQAERDSETQEIAEAGQQDVFDVNVGDCFDDADSTSDEISDVPAVPCAEPHDNEIFYLFDLAGDEYPVDTPDQADAGCYDPFTTFVGIDVEQSVLDYYTVPTTGTLAGAAR